jgi:hypothetical protein
MKAEVGFDRDTTMIHGSRRGGDGCDALSHGEDDRPRHLKIFCSFLCRAGGLVRAGLRESFNESMRESCA